MTSLQNTIKATILIVAFFVSCSPNENAPKTAANKAKADSIAQVIQDSLLQERRDSLSVEVSEEIEIVYTDSAILRAVIKAPIMKRYPTVKDPYIEMPNGVNASFYNEHGEKQSDLRSNYAKSFEKSDIIEIKDSVVVLNKNDEEIKTNELIWDKKKHRVYSNQPVSVRIRDEKIIHAKGFESEETFMSYTFKDITGIVYLEEEGVTTDIKEKE